MPTCKDFVHELKVHQIELELQNQELQQARNAAEAAAEEFSNLYDFAPVGYLTLDREGFGSPSQPDLCDPAGYRTFPAGGTAVPRCRRRP